MQQENKTDNDKDNDNNDEKDMISKNTDEEDEEGMKEEDWNVISNLPGNSNCIDCNAKYPEWASIHFGILFCTRCCSGHRSLGSQYSSRVRSIRFDQWTERQVQKLKVGGNQQFQEFVIQNGLSTFPITRSHKIKYDNPIAKLYAEILEARVSKGRSDDDGKESESTEEEEVRQLLKSRGLKQQQQQSQLSILEWGRMGSTTTTTSSQQHQAINWIPRIIKMTSSSDFWLYLYASCVILSFLLYVCWNLRELYRTYFVVVP